MDATGSMPTPPPLAALIADAEPYICRVFQARLEKNHAFEVTCAASPASALEQASQRDFDVIVWDLRLGETGSALPQIRALCPRAAILLTTTEDHPQLDSRFQRLGIADILTKPFGLDPFVERIQLARLLTPRASLPTRFDLLAIGLGVTIFSPAGVCHTRVLETEYDTFCVIGAPRVEVPDDWQPGLTVEVVVSGESARYRFQTTLTRLRPRPYPCWELAMPELVRREQQRMALRSPLRLPITLRRIVAPVMVTARTASIVSPTSPTALPPIQTLQAPEPSRSEAPTGEETAHARRDAEETNAEDLSCLPVSREELPPDTLGRTSNLSRSGCVFVAPFPLPIGETVGWELDIAGQSRLCGTGQILRTVPVPSDLEGTLRSGVSHESALRFDALSSTDQAQLEQLLFVTS